MKRRDCLSSVQWNSFLSCLTESWFPMSVVLSYFALPICKTRLIFTCFKLIRLAGAMGEVVIYMVTCLLVVCCSNSNHMQIYRCTNVKY